MKLISIELSNYQGIRKFSYAQGPDAGDIVVIGENEAGKTTIANALTWLLTNKPYTGEKNYSPKTITESGDMHGAEHYVKAIYVGDDGDTLKLSKIYKEIWTKKRGNTEAEFTGHTTEYFLDGVPVSEKDYNAEIAKTFGDAATIMQLTVPTHFAEVMSWQDRRALIMAMSGAEVTDADVIASTEELAPLVGLLSKGGSKAYTVDELMAIKSREKTKINDELKMIPARIDERARMLDGALTKKQVKELEADLADHQLKLEDARADLANLQDATIDQAQRVRIAELKAELAETEAKFRQGFAKINADHDEALRIASAAVRAAVDEVSDLRNKQNQLEKTEMILSRKVTDIRAERDAIRVKYAKVQSEQYQGDTACPTCKRDYDIAHLDRAQAHFNQDKSQRLKAIAESSRAVSDEVLQKALDDVAECQKQQKSLEAKLEDARASWEEKERIVAELEASRAPMPVFAESDEYKCINEQLMAAANSDEEIANHHNAAVQAALEDVNHLVAYIKTVESQLEYQKQLEQSKQRIAELEAREKELAASFESAMHAIWLCEEFKRVQATLLTDTINSQFKTLKVKLFDDQINGGLKDTCEVLIPSDAGALVPYKAANNAGRINAGLEIIERLAAYYGRSLPVIIDNAESVNHIYTSAGLQLILLEVAPAGTPLTITTANEGKAVA